MKKITTMLCGIAMGWCMAASVAQAASIQSMTIEEIGIASGGLGTSTSQSLGGEGTAYDAYGALFGGGSYGFVSAGSADGTIIMGSLQGNNAFTLGFAAAGKLNTLRGAPSGSITGGVMTLDISGLSTEDRGFAFSVSPDDNPITAVSMIDPEHYYYTADWSHRVTAEEVFSLITGANEPGFAGWSLVGHLEGVATLAPVPEADTYAMMLAGLGLVGFMAHRRRKSV